VVALETKAMKIYYFNILLELYKAIFYFKKIILVISNVKKRKRKVLFN
jgi:hypothetical protein